MSPPMISTHSPFAYLQSESAASRSRLRVRYRPVLSRASSVSGQKGPAEIAAKRGSYRFSSGMPPSSPSRSSSRRAPSIRCRLLRLATDAMRPELFTTLRFVCSTGACPSAIEWAELAHDLDVRTRNRASPIRGEGRTSPEHGEAIARGVFAFPRSRSRRFSGTG